MKKKDLLRTSVIYFWNPWYFLLAVFGSLITLLLGALLSNEANGTALMGGVSFYFTGTHPLICLALLLLYDLRISQANYGGLPHHIFFAWKPSFIRCLWRIVITTCLTLASLGVFALSLAIAGSDISAVSARCFVYAILQSISISLIYSILHLFLNPLVFAVCTCLVEYLWILLPDKASELAAFYSARTVWSVGVNLNGTAISHESDVSNQFQYLDIIPCGLFLFVFILLLLLRSRGQNANHAIKAC